MEKILYKGKLETSQIEILDSTNSFSLPTNLGGKAKKIWERERKIARERKVKLFDSEIYRLEKVDFLNKKLFLTLGIIPYSIQKVTKYLINEITKIGGEYYPKGLFTTALIMTEEDQYVFGNRGNTVSVNTIDMIGGVLSRDEGYIEKSEDLFKAITRELKEELNVNKEDIKKIYLSGVIFTDTFKVGLLFFIILNLSVVALNKVFLYREDKEMSSLVFVKKKRLRSFLLSLGGYKTIIADNFI